jgi:predicted dehydrogenase
MTNSAKKNVNRRSFLKIGASVATVSILPHWILGSAGAAPPSEKIYIAIIGVGGQGRTNAEAYFANKTPKLLQFAIQMKKQITHLSIMEEKRGGPVKQQIENHYSKQNPSFKCKEYENFRLMFEKEKAIDAVLIATPDHVHAVATAAAMRLKKNVYCEKPLTHNVWEARQIAKIAKETKVATQMGNQGHSGEGIRMTCEWIWAGAIGQVREVHVWSDTGGWAKAPGRPKETPPVPKGLNWDLWLGPREHRPYHPTYAPCNWRGWWPFGTGAIGDMACHNFDPAFWALKLESPISIEASAPWVDNDAVSPCAIIRYNFPARGDMPPVKVTWYDGGLRPEKPEELEEDQVLGGGGNGILFIGDKGKIMCAGWGRHLYFYHNREWTNLSAHQKPSPVQKAIIETGLTLVKTEPSQVAILSMLPN